MKRLRIAIVLCTCFAFLSASAQEKLRYSQVKIFVPKRQVADLQKRGLDFDHAHYNNAEQSITTTLEANEINKLSKTGFRYQIAIDNEEEAFLKRNDPKDFFKYDNTRNKSNQASRLMFNTPDKGFTSTIVTPAAFNPGSMGGYLTFAEMKKEMDSMVLNYPGLVRLDSIGRTFENRAIWCMKISDNVATDETEPEILFTGMHHAREPLGMENLIFFMQYLLENYSTNARIKEIVNSRELYFIPCMNPDGYVYNQSTNPTGGGLWRKNRQPNASDAGNPGQDLNRNYGFGFNYPNGGSSSVTSSQTYHGDSAFSAMETQVMKKYLRTRNFQYALNYHSYGGYWIHGYCVPTGLLSPIDSAVIKTTGAMATKHSSYEVGTPMQTVGYEGNGTSDDWFLGGDAGYRPPVYAISPEVGFGLATFWPPASSIIGYCKEAFFSNLQAALFAGSYVDIEDKTSLALTTTSGSFNFLVRRIGRVDSSVKITVIPLQNIASVGAPVTIASLPSYLITSSPSITFTLHPAITAGQMIKYIIKTETGGVTGLDTLIKFYNPIMLLNNNMDAGTFSTSWTSTSWNYSTATAYSGTRSLHESAGATYGNSLTSIVNSATNLDLSNATAAYLSFWIRHKSQAGYDKLQIKVSTNGTTYTALPGVHTIAESQGTLGGIASFTGYQDYWVKEEVNLNSVLGAGAVRLRFEFTSDASGTDEGFFIDDLQVMKSTVPLVILAVKFTDVKAIKAENKVLVRWESDIDAGHKYFEVERSSDGANWITIYTTTDRTRVYFAADQSPVAGTNYYRIKAVGEAGLQYSKTVSVVYTTSSLVKLYPNPVREQLYLELNGLIAGRYQLQIITTSGQVASYKEFEITSQFKTLMVTTTGITKGNYQLCIRKESGELIEVSSFSKL